MTRLDRLGLEHLQAQLEIMKIERQGYEESTHYAMNHRWKAAVERDIQREVRFWRELGYGVDNTG